VIRRPSFTRFLISLAAAAVLVCLPACSRPPATTAADSLPILSPLPTELTAALDTFRAEGPKGWAFTQTTAGSGKERVERYDPRRRGAGRWTLLSERGVEPTAEEQRRYRDMRPSFDSSANVAAQLDRATAVLAAEDATSVTYQFRLLTTSEEDRAAAHMRARITLDRPTGAVTLVELFTAGPFKAAISLFIDEARTTITYALPTADKPALPQEVSMHVKGKRFWFRDFEETVVSTYSDQENAAPAAEAPTP